MRILIADSNPARMDLYKRILEKDEHEILTAKSDIEVSIAYKRNKIDVAVFDLGVSDYIKNLIQAYGTPVVAISDSKEKETKTFLNEDFAIRKFNERNVENILRDAVKKINSLEQAVA